MPFLQSCNTLYNVSTIKIEIIVPGKIEIPSEYKTAAIRYNNCNIAVNCNFDYYQEDNETLINEFNIDSVAAEVYFQNFAAHLKNQQFFDTIFELEQMNYSDIETNDSLVYLQISNISNGDSVDTLTLNTEVFHFTEMVKSFSDTAAKKSKIKFIDPKLGLYSKEEINQIADSTGADLLFSFDYFASIDGIFSPNFLFGSTDTFMIRDTKYYDDVETGKEVVNVLSYWNFYDLRKQELTYSYRKIDTIKWVDVAKNLKEAKRVLPPRKDAVLSAADIAGISFAEFLVPHWIDVERMYYKSGHVELKNTDELIKQNRWLEAAEIWKKNTSNSNKSIAAKSMFNMALACEMNGDMDAAIDWAVKSFYVFGNKNEIHADNCQNYIRILAQRKLDIRKIENKLNPN